MKDERHETEERARARTRATNEENSHTIDDEMRSYTLWAVVFVFSPKKIPRGSAQAGVRAVRLTQLFFFFFFLIFLRG